MLTLAFSEGNSRPSDPGIDSGKRLRSLVHVGLPVGHQGSLVLADLRLESWPLETLVASMAFCPTGKSENVSTASSRRLQVSPCSASHERAHSLASRCGPRTAPVGPLC